jgi:hypothetical protein
MEVSECVYEFEFCGRNVVEGMAMFKIVLNSHKRNKHIRNDS